MLEQTYLPPNLGVTYPLDLMVMACVLQVENFSFNFFMGKSCEAQRYLNFAIILWLINDGCFYF